MNHRTLSREFLALICLTVGSLILFGCGSAAVLPRSPSEGFESFVDGYLKGKLFEEDEEAAPPLFASLMASSDSARAVRSTKILGELRSIDTTRLSVDQKIDWLQIEASLKRDIRDTVLHRAATTPIQYFTVGSLYWQIAGQRKPSIKEWADILKTLEDAPKALRLGRLQLQHPPSLWVRLAVNTSKRYEEFLGGLMTQTIQQSAPDSLMARLLKATREATVLQSHFRIFLSDTLKPAREGSWAVGTDYYDWLLKHFHFLPYTSVQLIETGWKIHNETKSALSALARRIDSTKSWKQLVDDMKSIHPEPYKITDAYRSESNRVRNLLMTKRLVAIPPAETLVFVPTPPALRETYAWGGYGGIEMRDSVMVGRFFVTDIVTEMSADQIQEKLRTQNTGWLTVISLHEGYPGHHLQNVYARNNPRKVRGKLGSTYYGEGWALYCESWMAREGFYLDAWDSLGWLQMRLWRTARVIIDPSIHTGKMTFEQAVQFFVDEVGLERSAAEAEVNRYTTWPTQAPSYIIGWLEIEKLKEEIKQELGATFSEKEFNENVLRAGSLPLELMKRAVRNRYGPDQILPVN